MNGSQHATLVHAAYWKTPHSDLVHMIKNLKIAYGTSGESRKMGRVQNRPDIALYISQIS
jgi:hypothetical protein